MKRNILSVIAGLLAAMFTIAIVQALSSTVYPPPEGLDFNDRAAMRDFFETLPTGAFLFVLASYVLGSFVGGAVTSWISREAYTTHVPTIGVILSIAGIMNLIQLPHPAWFALTSMLVYIPFAYLGGTCVYRLRRSVLAAGEPPAAPPADP